MQELANQIRHPGIWTVNIQLLLLYLASVVLFFAIHWGNLKALAPLAGKTKAGSPLSLLPIFVLAAGSSFFGVATIVVLAKKAALVPPLAILALPLFLTLESHARELTAAKDQTRFHLSGAAGVLLGMASSTWLWMRHNPLL